MMQQLSYAGYTCALCICDIFEMISEVKKDVRAKVCKRQSPRI